ncbi:origin recognition complex subunit 1 [Pseudomyrmex gracilis]|uniref:origin recognition complex subunit 1 n=1 Tax=Pseudomyrmex gracilis TaxID=219809 RepID=UPI0009952217|nr:origin recognition complex subunit 1 [Pseudomyrmex gracilis]
MSRLKKCTERDISMLLETNSDDEVDECDQSYLPQESSSESSENSEIFENNKQLLLRANTLRKEQVSLRLKLRRSTEQSAYKIDTESEDERPRRSIRSTRYRSQDENQMPRKGKRMIQVPKRYSDYTECYTLNGKGSVLQREQINYNEKELLLASLDNKNKRKTEINKHIEKNNDSDSDCVCIDNISSSRTAVINTNTPLKGKRRSVSPVEDIADNTPPKVFRTKPLRHSTLDKGVKKDNAQLENGIHSDLKIMKQSPIDTPRRKLRFKDKDKNKIDEIEDICEVAKEKLSIKTKNDNKDTKNTAEESLAEINVSTPKTQDQDAVCASRSRCSSVKMRTETLANSSTPLQEARTPKSCRTLKHSSLTPSMKMRTEALAKPATPLQEARNRLHVSIVPKSLPCREEEFNNIYTFLESKLTDKSGGCIYISGVPGTGKTATVNEVVKCLQKSVKKGKLSHFDFVEINGMKLSEPRQVYVQILKQLSGTTLTWEQAHNALEKRFTSKAKNRPMTLLLVDELDLLCTKRQDVIYNLLDWPTKASARLVVITIANTMDLPERVLMGRITSRLGLTRVTFQPYSHTQLQEIVVTRLQDVDIFKSEAIQLIARKVSAVSGDARRALDICRRTAEIAETRGGDTVTIQDVNEALSEMITNPKIQAIQHCSKFEQLFLQAVHAEVTRTGVEEVSFQNVYRQLEFLCTFDGHEKPNITQALDICARLGDYRLLICDYSGSDIHQRILLNVSKDDIHYALQTNLKKKKRL